VVFTLALPSDSMKKDMHAVESGNDLGLCRWNVNFAMTKQAPAVNLIGVGKLHTYYMCDGLRPHGDGSLSRTVERCHPCDGGSHIIASRAKHVFLS
jgi:hypothetical protein